MPTLLDHLAGLYPTAKRTTLRRMVADGRVRVGGQVARDAKREVAATDVVEVRDQRPAAGRPRAASLAPLRVVHEDADLLVVDKPPGLLTSTTPRETRLTALALVRGHYAGDRGVRVGLIHRLDRDAGGLLVFARTAAAFASLKAQFFHHTVERVYLAVTEGVPNPRAGRIDRCLVERADGTVRVDKSAVAGRRAVTDYEVVRDLPGPRTVVRVRLHTGRKHQIRAHLAARGTPIVGDPLYGETPAPAGNLMLCAVVLALDHPRTGRRVRWELDTPPFMRRAVGQRASPAPRNP